MPGQHKEWAFNTLLLLYYSQVLELSAIVVGLVLGVAIVVDAVSDPIVGSLSDNFKSRLGRMHPFILFSIIPTTLSMFALFSPPETLSTLGLTAWLFTWTIAIRICFSFYGVPLGASHAQTVLTPVANGISAEALVRILLLSLIHISEPTRPY